MLLCCLVFDTPNGVLHCGVEVCGMRFFVCLFGCLGVRAFGFSLSVWVFVCLVAWSMCWLIGWMFELLLSFMFFVLPCLIGSLVC